MMKTTTAAVWMLPFAHLLFSPQSAPAAPGVVIEAEERLAGDDNDKVRKSTLFITRDALRMDGVRGRNLGTVIYLAETKEFLLLDKKNQTYRRLPRQKIDAALDKAQVALAKIRAKAEEIAPDKSGEVNALLDAGLSALKKAADAEGAAQLVYKLVEDDVVVGDRITSKYHGTRDEEKVAEIFTVPADSLGIPPETLILLEDARNFFDGAIGKLTGIKANGALFPALGSGKAKDYSGIPVRRVRYEDGLAVADWVLKEIRKEDIPATTFSIPEGYTEKKFGLSVE